MESRLGPGPGPKRALDSRGRRRLRGTRQRRHSRSLLSLLPLALLMALLMALLLVLLALPLALPLVLPLVLLLALPLALLLPAGLKLPRLALLLQGSPAEENRKWGAMLVQGQAPQIPGTLARAVLQRLDPRLGLAPVLLLQWFLAPALPLACKTLPCPHRGHQLLALGALSL